MANNRVIARAPTFVDPGDFKRLVDLIVKNQWLSRVSESLHEVWGYASTDFEKELLEHLIGNILFVDETMKDSCAQRIAEEIASTWGLQACNTFLVAVADNSSPDGSQDLLQALKNKFPDDWSENNFVSSIAVIGHRLKKGEVENNSKIILVDDFIGTGKTMERKFIWLSELAKKAGCNIDLRFVSLAAMNFSKQRLDALAVTYYSANWLKKGISDMINLDQVKQAITSMSRMEGELKPKYKGLSIKDHTLGYGKSETLFAMGWNNIPNNVFPLFWWPQAKYGIQRKTLFRRLR